MNRPSDNVLYSDTLRNMSDVFRSPDSPPPAGPNSRALPRDTDVLCVPAHPGIGDSGDSLELRRLSTGELVAIAFSSPDALVSQLGEYQPWITLPAIAFSALVKSMEVHRVLIDPLLDPGVSRWGAVHIAEVVAGEQR